MGAGFLERHGNVYIYVPNLIGRSAEPDSFLKVVSWADTRGDAEQAMCACCAQQVPLDLPGPTPQPLDMVTDRRAGAAASALSLEVAADRSCACRLATAGLLVILCLLYPDWYMAALLTLMLDILSHWTHMYSTLVAGSSSHKVSLLLLVLPSSAQHNL